MQNITLEDVQAAEKRIREHIRTTPLDYSPFYSQKSGSVVYLKLENLQKTGSFKIRGALNAFLSLSQEDFTKKIIVASAGNHAQGIGYAAKLLGKESQTIICVPGNTPQTKIDAIRRYGVKLEIIGEIYDDAENYAIQKAKDENLLFISPYNHPDIIAGQGTVGLEILQQAESLDYILVPLSGGGLLAGILVAMKELKPELKIFGVQSEACPVMVESLKQGEIVDVPMSHSIAEGLHGGVEKGSITFPILQHYIEDVLLVSEQEIGDAIVDLIREHHQICEGAGAVGLAAIGRYKELFIQKTGVVVISGGNINYDLLQSLICSRKEN